MKKLFVLFLLLAAGASQAQPAPQSVTIDPQLWSDLQRAVADVPMSANAHQQIQSILANVQREAQSREMRAKADTEAKRKATDDK